jgi:tagatose-1,6-bisphosphate aldolase
MNTQIAIDLMWWLSAVELPALGGLFWLTQQQRERLEQAMHQMQTEHRAAISATRAALSDFKLDVAQRYASIAYLKDVETRLTEHLLRIEAKLDQPARV